MPNFHNFPTLVASHLPRLQRNSCICDAKMLIVVIAATYRTVHTNCQTFLPERVRKRIRNRIRIRIRIRIRERIRIRIRKRIKQKEKDKGKDKEKDKEKEKDTR